jgi:DNA-binding NarL/FixJ family response regulator
VMDKALEDTARKISVLLAYDHTMFRQGLVTILASYGGVEVVGEVSNDSEALRLAGELNPDVVIMQVQMPFQRAKESLGRLRALPHPPKVIVVTMFEEPHYVRSLMELGASAYLVKTSSSEHLVAAVRAAVFDPRAKNAVVGMPTGEEVLHASVLYRVGALAHADPRSHAVGVEHLHAAHHAA